MKTLYCQACGKRRPNGSGRRYCLACAPGIKAAKARIKNARLLATNPEYARKQAEHNRMKTRRRKTTLRGLPATLTAADWRDTLDAFGSKCAYCDTEMDFPHQDHVVPVAAGGGYVKGNIVPSCPSCNRKKSDKPLREWLNDEDRYQFICDMTALV